MGFGFPYLWKWFWDSVSVDAYFVGEHAGDAVRALCCWQQLVVCLWSYSLMNSSYQGRPVNICELSRLEVWQSSYFESKCRLYGCCWSYRVVDTWFFTVINLSINCVHSVCALVVLHASVDSVEGLSTVVGPGGRRDSVSENGFVLADLCVWQLWAYDSGCTYRPRLVDVRRRKLGVVIQASGYIVLLARWLSCEIFDSSA